MEIRRGKYATHVSTSSQWHIASVVISRLRKSIHELIWPGKQDIYFEKMFSHGSRTLVCSCSGVENHHKRRKSECDVNFMRGVMFTNLDSTRNVSDMPTSSMQYSWR